MKKIFKLSRIGIFSIIISGFLISFATAQTNHSKLAEAVRSNIANYFPENNINVKAQDNGRIILNGTVNVLYDKLRIFEVVTAVKGVHFIENDILVDTPDLPDNEILANIQDELNVVKSISEPELLNIAVTNGVVILQGKVRFQREKTVLETVVSWQEGVKGIVNNLEVMPIMKAVSDNTLAQTIGDLLHNQFSLEKKVNFDVKVGHVTLDGKVRTLWAKYQIEKDIRRIVGVTKVINNLTVDENYDI